MTNPAEIAQALEWDCFKAIKFSSELMAEVNEHNLAHALQALAMGQNGLAIEFIKLDHEQTQAGELTPQIASKRALLLSQLESP